MVETVVVHRVEARLCKKVSCIEIEATKLVPERIFPTGIRVSRVDSINAVLREGSSRSGVSFPGSIHVCCTVLGSNAV